MNVLLTFLQLIMEVFRELYQKHKQEEKQNASDAIDTDPANVFLSKFKKDGTGSTSVSNTSKRDSE